MPAACHRAVVFAEACGSRPCPRRAPLQRRPHGSCMDSRFAGNWICIVSWKVRTSGEPSKIVVGRPLCGMAPCWPRHLKTLLRSPVHALYEKRCMRPGATTVKKSLEVAIVNTNSIARCFLFLSTRRVEHDEHDFKHCHADELLPVARSCAARPMASRPSLAEWI